MSPLLRVFLLAVLVGWRATTPSADRAALADARALAAALERARWLPANVCCLVVTRRLRRLFFQVKVFRLLELNAIATHLLRRAFAGWNDELYNPMVPCTTCGFELRLSAGSCCDGCRRFFCDADLRWEGWCIECYEEVGSGRIPLPDGYQPAQ